MKLLMVQMLIIFLIIHSTSNKLSNILSYIIMISTKKNNYLLVLKITYILYSSFNFRLFIMNFKYLVFLLIAKSILLFSHFIFLKMLFLEVFSY